MSRCKFCKRPIKWLEVPVDTPAGSTLKAKPFEPRARRGEPLRPHECTDKGLSPRPAIDDDHEKTDDEIPWWLKY